MPRHDALHSATPPCGLARIRSPGFLDRFRRRIRLTRRQRVIVRQNLELHPHRSQAVRRNIVVLRSRLLRLRSLARQPRRQKSLRPLQVPHQLHCPIAITRHPQPNHHIAITGRLRLNRRHLHTRRQNRLQIHHDRGPRKTLAQKQCIEKMRARQHRRVLRLAHPLLILALLILSRHHLRVHRIDLRLRNIQLLLHHVRSHQRAHRQRC